MNSDNVVADIDGYETITDYSLLEQVRDAIDDIQSTKPSKSCDKSNKTVDISDTNFVNQIINKMNATSQSTNNRIKGAILEIHAHQSPGVLQHECKENVDNISTSDLVLTDDDSDSITKIAKPNAMCYDELVKSVSSKINELLTTHENTLKTKKDLCNECRDEHCTESETKSFMNHCPCVGRIDIILGAYQKYTEHHNLWGKVSVSSIFCCCNTYGFQQLVDDFLHIRVVHLDSNEANTIEICEWFEDKYECDLRECNVFARHYRDRTDHVKARALYYHDKIEIEYGQNKANDIRNDKDIVFQQELDKIHSYFLHSTLRFGQGHYFDENDTHFDERRDQINTAAKGRSYSKKPIVKDLPPKPIKTQRTAPLYNRRNLELIAQGVSKGRKYKNMYATASDIDCNEFKLNPPVEPSNIVYAQTEYAQAIPDMKSDDSLHDDYLGLGEDTAWIRSISGIQSESEIYNKLVQFCGIFRWQNAHGFRSRHFQGLEHISAAFENIKEEVLHNKYHWITKENWNQTLRKAKSFANSWASGRIRAAYDGHFLDQVSGIRCRWKKDDRCTLGEVVTLKLYTDFDRLQFELKKCFRWEYTQEVIDLYTRTGSDDDEVINGNSARIGKDLSKRHELVDRLRSFYHWRQSLVVVLNKFGRKIDANCCLYHGVNAKMILNPAITPAFYGPLSSSRSFHVAKTFATDKGMVLTISSQYPRLGICRAFDASLISDYPEEQEWLIGFIYTRIRKIHTKELQLPTPSNLRFVFFALHLFGQQMFSMSSDLEQVLIQTFLDPKHDDANADKILNILRRKYKQFRLKPNTKQLIRIDEISPKLRQYFMTQNRISFAKIQKIFENVKEIHFYNYFACDNQVLSELIRFVDGYHHLQQIKFLYYDYVDDDIEHNSHWFDPSKWHQKHIKQLELRQYKIVHKRIMHYGYKIRIFRECG